MGFTAGDSPLEERADGVEAGGLGFCGQTCFEGKGSMTSRILLLCLFITALLSPRLDAQQYTLSIGTDDATPDEDFAVPVEGSWADPLLGYSLSIITSPTVPVSNLDVTLDNTVISALNPELFLANVNSGEIIVALLFEFLPPFDGIALGSFGGLTPLCYITGTVDTNATPQTIDFTPVDGLGAPPTINVFSVQQSLGGTPIDVPPTTMTAGSLEIVPAIPTPVFIRGDVNLTGQVDIADSVFILTFLFGLFGGQTPPCLDAADANDDGFLNIGDPVYLLEYLFGGGSQPPEPFDVPGDDTTPDFHNLSCLSW